MKLNAVKHTVIAITTEFLPVPEHFGDFSIVSPVPARRRKRENSMFKKLIGAAAVAALTLGMATSASADRCSGHNHLGGTIIGGVAGGVIGNAVTHGNAAGTFGGGAL